MMRHFFCCLLLFVVFSSARSQAPAPGGQTQVGPVTVSWGKGFSYAGNSLRGFGGVQMTSATFGMTAQTVTLELAPTKAAGVSGLRRMTADGGAGKPVTGHFEQIELSRSFQVQADHAVYTPAPDKAQNTGTIDFTGHVVLQMRDPVALDGPAALKSEHMTVQLGAGPNFPQIDGDAGALSFTPLQ